MLAARAGVSRALIFHYFDTRQGMQRAMVIAARDALLEATLPRPELAPAARVHDVLVRITRFVAEHLRTAFVELGETDSPALRLGLRSWVAFAEETFVALAGQEDAGQSADERTDGLIAFLEHTLTGVVAAAREARL